MDGLMPRSTRKCESGHMTLCGECDEHDCRDAGVRVKQEARTEGCSNVAKGRTPESDQGLGQNSKKTLKHQKALQGF